MGGVSESGYCGLCFSCGVGFFGEAIYFVCDYGAGGCARVGGDDDAAVEDAADDGGAGAGGFGEGDAAGVEGGIAIVVGEVEARHGGGGGEEWSRGKVVMKILLEG